MPQQSEIKDALERDPGVEDLVAPIFFSQKRNFPLLFFLLTGRMLSGFVFLWIVAALISTKINLGVCPSG